MSDKILTPVQDLIRELEQFAKFPMVDKPTIEAAIEFAKLRLEPEKQMINAAYIDGLINWDSTQGLDYYNETYKL